MSSSVAPPTDASNADVIRWAFEKLNEHDVTAVKQFWTAETIERFPDRMCRGAEEIAGYFEDAFRAIPDFHMEIVAIDGMDHFVFRDGVVISNFVVFDQMQYARQIGMMPADGSAADKSLKVAFNARTKLTARLRRSAA
jgi:hypothetical protein